MTLVGESPKKASWISYNQCFDSCYKSYCIRITEISCLLRDNHSNTIDNNELSFDTLQTGGCKPSRTVGERCGIGYIQGYVVLPLKT